MSYDLVVFDPAAAPTDRNEFEAWYDEIAEKWEEDRDFDEVSVATPALRSWFLEMIESFPAMNGPYAMDSVPEEKEPYLADYTIDRHLIYVTFRWSSAPEAYATMLSLAAKHRVGFLDASGDGSIWLLSDSGMMEQHAYEQ